GNPRRDGRGRRAHPDVDRLPRDERFRGARRHRGGRTRSRERSIEGGKGPAAALPNGLVLPGKGAGGEGQMRSLADALGWPYEEKQLAYNPLNHLPNVILGSSIVSLDRHRSSALAPPWPDLVIGASRRSAPVAQWIRKQSSGRTRLVHLL